MEELTSGEQLLKEIMQGLIITKDWTNLKKKVADYLFAYTTTGSKAITKVPIIDALSHPLRYQLVLEVVGPDMREIWGEAHEQAYKPELLREPYLTAGMNGMLACCCPSFSQSYGRPLNLGRFQLLLIRK